MISVKDHKRAESDQRTPASLDNYYLTCTPSLKLSILVQFLRDRRQDKVILTNQRSAMYSY